MSVIFKSLPYFNRWQTFLLYFVLLPVLQVILLVAIMQAYTDGSAVNIMTASIILSSASMSLNMISSLFVGDINRGIDRLLVVESPYSFYYWGTRWLACFFGAYLLAIINGLLFSLINRVDLYQILLLAPLAILCGFVIGLCGNFLSWSYQNVYFWSNLFSNSLVLLGGAIAPVSQYPVLFKILSNVFPLGKLLEIVHGNEFDLLGFSLILSAWCIGGIIIYIYQSRRIAQYSTKNIL